MALAMFGAIGCDAPTASQVEDDAFHQTQVRSSETQDDLTWGDNDALQTTDSIGDTYRFEREGAPGTWTHVRIYKNGSLQGRIHYEWSDSVVTGLRFEKGSDWADTDEAQGDIDDTSQGLPGGSPPCDPLTCPNPEFQLLLVGCDSEFDDMQSATWLAVGSLALTYIMVQTGPDPLDVKQVVGAARASTAAFVSLVAYVQCRQE